MKTMVPSIHIGEHIAQRIKELGISKSEFARRYGIHQQHVNKLLSYSSLDTEKLVRISNILEYNFFTLYTQGVVNISAIQSSVNTGKGTAINVNNYGSAQQAYADALVDKIKNLEATINDKNLIISLLEEKLKMFTNS